MDVSILLLTFVFQFQKGDCPKMGVNYFNLSSKLKVNVGKKTTHVKECVTWLSCVFCYN